MPASPTPPTELWFRNPHSYIRECVVAGVERTIWDRGVLKRLSIDAQRHALFHYSSGQSFLTAAIGDQGLAVMDRNHGAMAPLAVYPVWEYGRQGIDELERWMASNPAEELGSRRRKLDRPVDEIPVVGQDHVVAVIRPPNAASGVGMSFLGLLQELQDEYPACKLHLHGLYGYKTLFGGNFRSVDVDPREAASRGRIVLPSGRYINQENAWRHRKWLDLLGFRASDLNKPRNRCLFDIKAARWAAANWDSEPDMTASNGRIGVTGLTAIINGRSPELPTLKSSGRRRSGKAMPGDKLYCGACSFADSCRSYREGSVCSVSGTDISKLAALFGSRDSDKIVQGLGAIIEVDLDRLKDGLQDEKAEGLDPNVTKLTDNVFKHGTTLAKLVDPKLRSAALAIHLNAGGTARIEGGKTYQAQAADAMQALEAGGVPRDQITGDMVQKCIDANNSPVDLELIIASEAAKYALPAGIFDVDEVEEVSEAEDDEA